MHQFLSSFLFLAVPSPLMTGDAVFVAVGDVAVLTCSVSGTPNGTIISYRWKRAADVSAISGANSTIYMYQVSSSANMSDMGVYTCEVTVTDERNSPHVISATGCINITLTVASKHASIGFTSKIQFLHFRS